jgi:hypothetical protein
VFQTVAEELSILIGGGTLPKHQPSDFDKMISPEQLVALQKGGNLFFIQVILDL